MNILIVRLGALGDIVHAVPAAAALRSAIPAARIDWLVDAQHRGVLDLVEGIDRVMTLEGRTAGAWIAAVKRMREVSYDVAFDLQGLMKSAVLARASGARRVAGFSIWHLREKGARPFYNATSGGTDEPRHVIQKNLRLLRVIGIETTAVEFPFRRTDSPTLREVEAKSAGRPFALVNPGAAWPNKRWPAERFGEVAAFLRDVRGLQPFVLWGPGEETLAASVVEASGGAAQVAPPTTIADLIELSRAASLVVSGDTGPLHLAAAAGAPTVAIFGPTDPLRNGPWAPGDVIVDRYGACACHYDRRCHRSDWCLGDVAAAEVTAAVQQRVARAE